MSTYLRANRPAKHRQAISIFVDANYIPPAAYVASQLLAMPEAAICDVVILSTDGEGLDACEGIHPDLRLVEIDDSFKHFGISAPDDFPNRSFLNLFSPHIYGNEYDRIICVDADYHITQPDMFKLFDLNMKTYPIAAMKDIIAIYPEAAEVNYSRYIEPAGIATTTPYLNGGFQVIDSAVWLQEEVGERALLSTFERGGPKYLGDQRALNAVLKGDWMELSPNCNWAAVWPEQDAILAMVAFERMTPSGLHLLGAAKPWSDKRLRRVNPDVATAQEAFFAKTPWPDYVPTRDYANAFKRLEALREATADKALQDLFPEPVQTYLWQSEFQDVLQGLTPNFALKIPE